MGAGWALATPFIMESPGELRVGPPPEIDSDQYARAFNEVKEVGGEDSAIRAPDHSHLATRWKEVVEKSHNRLVRELAAAEALNAWEAARFFALLDISIFDGYVASFDSEFHYNHWRPYTAIRCHGTVCGAAMRVFGDVFGADRPFEMTIREVDAQNPMSPMVPNDPPTRSFDTFADTAWECSMSRVYLGIHFRYDSEVGTELGEGIGAKAVRTRLHPVRSPS